MINYAVWFQGRDLDCKIQEYKEAGKTFSDGQVIEWFIQLLLGVDYMHERYVLCCWGTGLFKTVMSVWNEILGGRTERKQDQKVNDYSSTSIIYFFLTKLLNDYIRRFTWKAFFSCCSRNQVGLEYKTENYIKHISDIWSYPVNYKWFPDTFSMLWIYYTCISLSYKYPRML